MAWEEGLYPALYLSSTDPKRSLKSQNHAGRSTSGIRKGLVLAQFAVAICLLVATVTITRQATFIANQDTGFDDDRILAISSLPRQWTADGVQNIAPIKDAIEDLAGVESASLAWGPPGPRYTGLSLQVIPEGANLDSPLTIPASQVDPDFLKTVGLELWEGSFFRDAGADQEYVVVLNQTAAGMLGVENPVGTYLTSGATRYRVLGVVRDYHTQGFEESIGPVALTDVRQQTLYRELLVRLTGVDQAGQLEAITTTWAGIYPEVAFDYYFVDDQWTELHRWVWRTKEIATGAALLAILVACLGLLGIVSITVRQRYREIAVRKVVGASLPSVLGLLTSEFVKLVVLAFLLASPVAYWGDGSLAESVCESSGAGSGCFCDQWDHDSGVGCRFHRQPLSEGRCYESL